MSCKIYYKGKAFSERGFREYYKNNKEEFTTLLESIKERKMAREEEIPPTASISHAGVDKPVYTAPEIFAKDATKQFKGENDGKYKVGDVFYDSVTSHVTPSMQTRPYTSTDTPGDRAAAVAWEGRDDSELISFPDLSIAPLSKQKYIDLINLGVEKGRAKGELLHLYIHEHLSKDPGVRSRIKEVMETADIHTTELSWITPEVIEGIISKTGTDYYRPGGVDKVHSEKIVGSKTLGWYGTVDMFIDHGDHVYSIYDLKTGYRFNQVVEASFFKYGQTSAADIFDTTRNRAKLQLMLYAFIVKMEHPEARFRNLDIIYIKNKRSLSEEDPYKSVNVPAYLEIIQRTLEEEHPELYKQISAKPHFKQLFDPASYTTSTAADFESTHTFSNAADLAKSKLLELQGLIMFDAAMVDLGVKSTPEIQKRRDKVSKLMQEVIKLKQDPATSMLTDSVNMGWLDRYLGSQSYSTNPYVQMYHRELSKAKQASRDNYLNVATKFDSLLERLIKAKGLKSISRFVGGVDRQKLFGFAYKRTPDSKIPLRLYTKDDPEFVNFSREEQDFLNFVNESISGVFNEEHAALIDPSNLKPLAKRVVTIRKWAGRDVNVTNLDLHNKAYPTSNKEAKANPFKWYNGFFPKFAPQMDDVVRMHSGFFNKGMLKFILNRYTTNYFETTFEQWVNTDEAIPMKYLGSDRIDASMNYTLNLETAYKSFMKHHIYKAQMDEVYTMGQAIRIYLDAKVEELATHTNPDREREDHLKNMIGWFEDSVNLHILGRKQLTMNIAGRSFGRVKDGMYEKFNWVKVLRSMKTFFSGPTMWLKPLSGLPNFVFASLVSIKEGIKTSLGLSTSNANFTLSDLAFGFGQALKLVLWDGRTTNAYRNNKTYILMEKFGYLPDNHDWYVSNNEMLTSKNQLFTSRSMMVFHSLPEEAIATALFVAQMKAMKFKKEDGTESNMWDSYKDTTVDLPDGSTHTTVDWVGGKRGVRNVSNIKGHPQYEDVTELTIEEINAIKFLYEKIHGGYRGDERVAAEYYVMGELYLQLKKYMPAILKNVWASKGVRYTQGNFVEEVDENGTKVMKWSPQVIEGRYRILLGLLYNYLSFNHKNNNGQSGNKSSSFLGLSINKQAWTQLSDAQKEDIHDFLLTTVMYLAMVVGAMKMWDRGDDDTLKKLYERIQNDFAGNVNPMEILKNLKNATTPTSFNRSYQLLSGSAELLWSVILYSAGYDDAALTKEGNFRGQVQVERNLHFLSSWHDYTSGRDNSEFLSEYLK